MGENDELDAAYYYTLGELTFQGKYSFRLYGWQISNGVVFFDCFLGTWAYIDGKLSVTTEASKEYAAELSK